MPYRLGYATRRFNQLIYLVKEQLVVKKPERRLLRETEESFFLESFYIVIAGDVSKKMKTYADHQFSIVR